MTSGHHLVLRIVQVDDGPRLRSTLLLDSCQVADSESVELPHELNAHIITTNKIVESAVGAEAEDAGLDVHAGGLKSVEHDRREERAVLLAADPHLRRLHQRALLGQLGAIGDRQPVKVGKRHRRVDQGNLQMIMLERNHDGPWVKPEHLREIGAVDSPLFARPCRLLLEIGDHVPGPIDLVPRHELPAQIGDSLDQVMPALDGVKRAGVHASILMDLEIGVGGHEQSSRSSQLESSSGAN